MIEHMCKAYKDTLAKLSADYHDWQHTAEDRQQCIASGMKSLTVTMTPEEMAIAYCDEMHSQFHWYSWEQVDPIARTNMTTAFEAVKQEMVNYAL